MAVASPEVDDSRLNGSGLDLYRDPVVIRSLEKVSVSPSKINLCIYLYGCQELVVRWLD